MKKTADRRHPIGHFEYGKNYSLDDTRRQIKTIAQLPKDLKKVLKKLRDGALDRPYRPGGWTARQVLNHLADSHMNAYIRCKLAVTENTPIIKPYEEKLWAETEDGLHSSPKVSIKLISALHKRWVDFLSALSDDELDRGYFHPANKRTVTIREAIALYAWHSKHHLAHIKLVTDGKIEKGYSKEKHGVSTRKTTNGRVSSVAKMSVDADGGKKKRIMSEAHKAKIRAAQQARRAAEAAAKGPVKKTVVDTIPKKRGRKPGQKAAVVVKPALDTTPKKRGRKPGQKAAVVVKPAASANLAKTRRPRRSSAEVAAEKAAKASAPKLSRAQVMEKARAAAAANRAVKALSAPKKAAPTKPRRTRRSSAEVAAEKAAKASAPKLSRAQVMEKARAAAAANRAAKGIAPKPKKDANAPKLTKAQALARAREARSKKK